MGSPVTRTRFGLTRRTVLTNAQIKALPTTEIEVVPAQGIGRAIVPILATLQLIWVADYTNIDGSAILGIGPSGSLIVSEALENPGGWVSFVLAPGGGDTSFISIGAVTQLIDANANMNVNASIGKISLNNLSNTLALNNQASGNLTGGDPGNSLIVNVFYNVIVLG